MPSNNLEKFKNIAIAVFLVFLMAAVVYSIFWGPIKKFTDSIISPKTVSISAEGKVTISPDIAKFSFSVVSEGPDPKTIAEDNVNKINSAISFVKSQGIDEKDIKTTEYNLNPRYEYDEKTKKTFISGYTLTQTVLIKVRDLNKVAQIIGGLPELGINKISSVSFGVDEPEKYLTEARNQAFDKAREKAETMADKNGVKLGQIINFYEYQSSPYYQDMYAKLGLGGAEAASPTLPQLQPGSQEVTVQVSVTYEIR